MTKREPTLVYEQMLEYAQKVITLTQGRTRTDLDTDWIAGLALVRLLEVIGEAADRIPKMEQAKHPEIQRSLVCAIDSFTATTQ